MLRAVKKIYGQYIAEAIGSIPGRGKWQARMGRKAGAKPGVALCMRGKDYCGAGILPETSEGGTAESVPVSPGNAVGSGPSSASASTSSI
jgi:hypothetical protein